MRWAGWANWEYRKQAAERLLASTAQGELVPDAAGGMPQFVSPLKGKPAPAFALEDLTGKKVSLASYKGKAVLINFWATWCGSVQDRDAVADRACGINTRRRDLRFWAYPPRLTTCRRTTSRLGEETKPRLHKFVQRKHMPYPVLIDGDSISKPYGGLDDLPTSFFVDRNGTVVAAQVGLTSKDDIEANIKKALGE